MTRTFLVLIVASALHATDACHVVTGDRITGRDLAGADPAFAALPSDLPVSFTPIAGVERIIRPDELVRLAEAHQINLTERITTLCFKRATTHLTPEKLLPVLERSLGIEGARIELLDLTRFEVVEGDIEFPRAGLSASGVWRGRVNYGPGLSQSIWTKVSITVEGKWVEAAVRLEAGRPVDPGKLLIRTGPLSPLAPTLADSIDSIAGKTPVRTIERGTPLLKSMFVAGREVERGDCVRVKVSSGHAALEFAGIAESPGRNGDQILIRNPESGRTFQARIEAKGTVFVKAEKDLGMEIEDR